MSLSSLSKALEKEGFVSDEKATPKNFLDTGLPHLNDILAGNPNLGLPSGRITEIAGESQSGKTMLATRLMISAQHQGGFAGFWDHERSYDLRLSVKQGMKDDPNQWLYRVGKSFEGSLVDSIKVARLIRENEYISPNAPIVFVYDSFASMVPVSKLGKDVDAFTMADTTALARAASASLPTFTTQVSDYNVCAVFLNQMADTMDMYGPKTKTKGGRSLPFYASVRLFLKGKEIKEKGKLIKKEMTIETRKNKVYMPHQEVEVDFVFSPDGSGDFDILRSYVKHLKELGAIEVSGAWVTWEGRRLQGINTLVDELSVDPVAGLDKLKAIHDTFRALR